MLILSYFNKSRTLISFGRKENSNLSDQFNPVYIVLHKVQEAVVRRRSVKKKRLWRRCFPVSFVKFPRITFLTEHLRWFLLKWLQKLGFTWLGYPCWTHFFLMLHFYTPWKHKKTLRFIDVFRAYEKVN